MKNAILGFFSIVFILLAGFAMSTSEGKTMRQNELDSTLSASMEKSMEILKMSKDYSIKDQKEFVADFIQNAMIKMNSESKYRVEVFTVDVEKGLLDAKVTQKYKKLLSPGLVSSRRTIILEDYVNENNEYFVVTFEEKGKPVKQISIYGGDFLSESLLPQPSKATDQWECVGTGMTYKPADFHGIAVTRNLTFQKK